jgi:hypothetical protein
VLLNLFFLTLSFKKNRFIYPIIMKKIFYILIFVVFSCSSEDNSNDNNSQNPSDLPVVETLVPEIVLGQIKFKGKVVSIGSGIISRGFCWSLTINPEINSNREEEYSSSSGDYFLTKALAPDVLKEIGDRQIEMDFRFTMEPS